MGEDGNFTRQDLIVEGLHCADCAVRLETTISSLGAKSISIDVASGRTALLIPEDSSLPEIMAGLSARGYAVKATSVKASAITPLDLGLIVTAILTLPLLLGMFFPALDIIPHQFVPLASTLAAAFGLFHFGRGAWRGLKRRELSMDALLFLGILGSLLHGYLSAQHTSYETSASITFFALIGAFMERRAVRSTTSAIDSLMRASPRTARRLKKPFSFGQYEEVVVSELSAGDRVVVANGESIPADAKVLDGRGAVDESFLSGESLPRAVAKDDILYAGSILVDGSLTLQVESKEGDNLLNQIIRSLAEARQRKPSIQNFGDRVSQFFVPIIIFIALFTYLILKLGLGLTNDESIMRALAVLVVACPCAMGLATPTAIVTTLGRLARDQIIVRSGAALEILAGVKNAIFDKTGTLTTGRFNLKKFEVDQSKRKTAAAAILGLELNSTHPIAKSLSQAIESDSLLEFKKVELLEAGGIHGFTADNTHFTLRPLRDQSSQLILLLEENEHEIARLVIEDQLQPQAADVISILHRLNFQTEILSGDSPNRCKAVADQIGIKKYRGGLTPNQKLSAITESTSQQPTVFIGDGINDSPALAAASVGISPGNATDLARYSADIVLLNGIRALPELLLLSKQTLRVIKQNLFWALGYNLVTVPLAISGAISPITAAIIMAFSDVVVVGNSLRLRFCKVT